MIDIDISSNLDEINDLLNDKTFKHAVRAARSGIRSGIRGVRKEAIKRLREKRAFKLKLLNKRIKFTGRVSGNTLDTLQGSITFSGKSIGLRHFVVGKVEPKPQAGVPVAKRRPVRVRVRKGRTVKIRKGFIARGRNNINHVFVRRTNKSTPLVRRGTQSLSHLINRPRTLTQLRNLGAQSFAKEFRRMFNGLMSGQIGKVNRSRLKKIR